MEGFLDFIPGLFCACLEVFPCLISGGLQLVQLCPGLILLLSFIATSSWLKRFASCQLFLLPITSTTMSPASGEVRGTKAICLRPWLCRGEYPLSRPSFDSALSHLSLSIRDNNLSAIVTGGVRDLMAVAVPASAIRVAASPCAQVASADQAANYRCASPTPAASQKSGYGSKW